jgi:hypothetical protein
MTPSLRSPAARATLRALAELVALHRRLGAGRRAVAAADVAAFRNSIRELPPLPAATSDAEAIWLGHRRQFRADVAARDPRRFLRWPVLRPMYKRNAPYLGAWLAELRAHREWTSRWEPALRESAVGDPRLFVEHRRSSGNLVFQAYHLCRFEEVTGVRISDVDFVVEFGGGYGALCRLAWTLGFAGTWAIYDFPEFSALQRLYLRAHGVPIGADRGPGLVTLWELDAFEALLARRPPGRAAFVALWSLSETPRALREAIAVRMAAFDVFAIGYQPTFGGIDNRTWFAALRARLGDGIAWHDRPVPHNESFRHLFGAPRDRQRFAAKNSLRSRADSSACTPPRTSGR